MIVELGWAIAVTAIKQGIKALMNCFNITVADGLLIIKVGKSMIFFFWYKLIFIKKFQINNKHVGNDI